MTVKYKISLKKAPGLMERYELSNNNTMSITVQFKRKDATRPCTIKLSMSKNAMFEFGKELIRDAYSNNEIGHSHFYPARPGQGISISLGIVLMPQSVEPIYWREPNNSADENQILHIEQITPSDSDVYSFSVPEDETDPAEAEVILDNVALFQVFDLFGNDISSECQYVIMSFSNQGAIGFGTEMIRLAHSFVDGKEVILINDGQQAMGISLQPESSQLCIKCHPFEPVEKYLEQMPQSTYTANDDTPDFRDELVAIFEQVENDPRFNEQLNEFFELTKKEK